MAFLLLSLLRMVAPKGVWCPACGLAALAPTTQRDVLIALAKQSILSKLRLPDRPNITQPTSREALLTALRRMRAQHTDMAVSPGMPQDSSIPHLRPGMGVQEYEILSFAESGSQRLIVELEVAEDWGAPILGGHRDSHWPFVAAQARARTPHRVQRRGIDCSGDSRMCCRKEFFVDFKEIGWEDWIIQPEGYHMNYCAGLCPLHMAGIPGLAASFHTAVLNLIKANNADAAVDSCCVPTQRRPLSLLYYDRDSNIVKTDIPDMIVDACGCT
nr:PREDICTED: inhibin beta C chain-like [Phalacrocorax carbo]